MWRHPQAGREIRLGEHLVGYVLRRARRRSIGFTVSADGLSVSAPLWASTGDLEKALQAKGPWIARKLAEQQERSLRLRTARVEWRSGAAIPFLGEPIIVVLDASVGAAPGAAVLDPADVNRPVACASTLRVGLPAAAAPEEIGAVVQGWLRRQARRVFAERCDVFAERLGVRYTRLALSSAQTRWGSANARGGIRLNWRLIHFALPTIDYVVAHELAHLREMNHGPRFWSLVQAVLPDYEQARRTLKADTLPQLD